MTTNLRVGSFNIRELSIPYLVPSTVVPSTTDLVPSTSSVQEVGDSLSKLALLHPHARGAA
jgi:hypothetical protein